MAAREAASPEAVARQRSTGQILARQALTASAPVIIVSPNPQSRWRILPGETIQRSTDGGGTWQTQQTGGTTTLVAGASPSAQICWIVGRGGTVLLSTDGATWKRVSLSQPIDLISVRATDDRNATVTAVDGRSFSTADGGATWRPR